jgi:hypothetical protein
MILSLSYHQTGKFRMGLLNKAITKCGKSNHTIAPDCTSRIHVKVTKTRHPLALLWGKIASATIFVAFFIAPYGNEGFLLPLNTK